MQQQRNERRFFFKGLLVISHTLYFTLFASTLLRLCVMQNALQLPFFLCLIPSATSGQTAHIF